MLQVAHQLSQALLTMATKYTPDEALAGSPGELEMNSWMNGSRETLISKLMDGKAPFSAPPPSPRHNQGGNA